MAVLPDALFGFEEPGGVLLFLGLRGQGGGGVGGLARVRLPVAATLDTTLRARELLMLRAGDVLSLGAPIHQSLDVRVRSHVKFRGRLTAAGSRAAIQVDETTACHATE